MAPADLNTLALNGFYRLPGGVVNGPPGDDVDYGQCIVSRYADTILQIVTGFRNGKIYFRHGNPAVIGGPGTYGLWREHDDTR